MRFCDSAFGPLRINLKTRPLRRGTDSGYYIFGTPLVFVRIDFHPSLESPTDLAGNYGPDAHANAAGAFSLPLEITTANISSANCLK